jgi:protein tyrosine kinase modulator
MTSYEHEEFESGGAARPDDAEGGVSLPAFVKDPVGVVRRRWLWMLAALALGFSATGVFFATWKPTYVAQATVLITGQLIPEDFVRSTVQTDTIANINAMVGRVLSKESIDRLIDELKLDAGHNANESRRSLINRTLAKIEVAPLKSYSASKRGGAGSLIYAFSYESANPWHAAVVANALATRFTEESIAHRGEQARHTTEFLRKQLERDERDYKQYSEKVSTFRREHRGELPEEQQTKLRKLEMLSQRYQSLSVQISEKENQLLTLSSAGGSLGQTPNEKLLSEARSELSREMTYNTDEHPNVIALKNRVALLKKLVAEEASQERKPDPHTKRQIEEQTHELELLKKQLADTDAESKEVSALVDQMPAVAQQLAALQQQAQVAREGYLESLRKVESAELAENLELAQQGAQVSILDAAQQPTSPKLSRLVVLIGGVAASCALSLAVAVLLELLDAVILNTDQLEGIAGRPALGSIPKIA